MYPKKWAMGFTLVTTSRTFVLFAENETMRRVWVKKLQRIIDFNKAV